MKDLKSIANQCIKELNEIGIEPPKIQKFTINSRAAKRWGQCSRENGQFSIQIASVLVEDDAPINGLKSTLMHEILHTMPNCFNHGNTWQAYADRVNKAYGYKITRVDSYKDKGFESNVLAQAHPYKYTVSCKTCGRQWYYRRNSSTVECCRRNHATCPCGAENFSVVNNY